MCSFSVSVFPFKDPWILKSRTVVCEDHREQLPIGCGSQSVIKGIKDFFDIFPAVSREQEYQHKQTTPEQKCQKNVSTFPASSFHNVHFHYGRVRILCHIKFKISISTSFPIARNLSVATAFLPGLIAYFSWKVQIDGGKKILVDIVV